MARHITPLTEPMTLQAAYHLLRIEGRPVKKCRVARLIKAKDGELALLKFETAGLLFQEEDDGLVRPMEQPE